MNGLFGTVSLAASNAFNTLVNAPADPAPSSSARKAPKPPLSTKATVGCCVYAGGQLPNVPQIVCDPYRPTSWGAPANCVAGAPPKKK